MQNNNIYFVYLLLDPRKVVLQPFYVGKGKDAGRPYHHFNSRRLQRDGNVLKNSIIKRIREAGLEPVVFRYAVNLTEEDAFNMERRLITRFGRRNLGKGILANLTDGGEGVAGYVFSEERKAEYREKFLGENNPMYGRTRSEDERQRMSKTRNERISNGNIVPTKHTDDHKQHLREDVERRRKNGFGRPARRVLKIDSSGNIIEIFESTTALAKFLGLASNSNIKNIAAAGCKQRDGFWYRYADLPNLCLSE